MVKKKRIKPHFVRLKLKELVLFQSSSMNVSKLVRKLLNEEKKRMIEQIYTEFVPRTFSTHQENHPGYIVKVQGSKVSIFLSSQKKAVASFKVERILFSKDPGGKSKGKAILLDLGKNRYVLINDLIRKFRTREPIVAFYGETCWRNSWNTWYSVITKTYVYLLDEPNVYFKRFLVQNTGSTPFHDFFDSLFEKDPKTRESKLIRGKKKLFNFFTVTFASKQWGDHAI